MCTVRRQCKQVKSLGIFFFLHGTVLQGDTKTENEKWVHIQLDPSKWDLVGDSGGRFWLICFYVYFDVSP